jgi:hypothetical protein
MLESTEILLLHYLVPPPSECALPGAAKKQEQRKPAGRRFGSYLPFSPLTPIANALNGC